MNCSTPSGQCKGFQNVYQTNVALTWVSGSKIYQANPQETEEILRDQLTVEAAAPSQ